MIKNVINKALLNNGFEADKNFEGVSIYIKEEFDNNEYKRIKYVCFVIDNKISTRTDITMYDSVTNAIHGNDSFCVIKRLFVIITDKIDKDKKVFEDVSEKWFISDNRLIIFEDAPEDFSNIKNMLESGIYALENVADLKSYKQAKKKNIPFITITLIAINVIIFLVLEALGDTEDGMFMSKYGTMSWMEVVYEGRYYELLTCMFLHFGFEHIVSNMFMLGILGSQIENVLGKIRYASFYIVSGVGGGIASIIYHMLANEDAICAGASGAIYGLFGALIVMAYKSRKSIRGVSAPRLIALLALMIFGNVAVNIDVFAHFGGAVCGAIMTMIVYNPKKGDKLIKL